MNMFEFPKAPSYQRRGIVKGAHLSEAPLDPASFLPFLPEQEREPAGRRTRIADYGNLYFSDTMIDRNIWFSNCISRDFMIS